MLFFRHSVEIVNGRSIVLHICLHIKILLMVSLDWRMLETPIEMLLEEFVLKVICLQSCELIVIFR